MLREFVRRGAELHPPHVESFQSPLLTLLWDTLEYRSELHFKTGQRLLQIWLEDLEAYGVDLVEYGCNEPLEYTDSEGQPWRPWHDSTLTFTFGASPKDWRLSMLGSFRALTRIEDLPTERILIPAIEAPPAKESSLAEESSLLSVPGTWID